MIVTNQERQNLIRSETTVKGLCGYMLSFPSNYLQDAKIYLEVIKTIPIQKIDLDFVWHLLSMYCNYYESSREITVEILTIYLNRIYGHLLFDEPDAHYTDDIEDVNVNEWLKVHLYYPLLLALQNEINREKYPITDHRRMFGYLVYEIFNVFIPCDYMDIADSISSHYDLRKPDHGLQEIYDEISQWNFEDSFAATQYVSMFEAKLQDLFNNFYTRDEFINGLMNEVNHRYPDHYIGTKEREIVKRFTTAFPEIQSLDFEDFVFNIFNGWNMTYIKEIGNKDDQQYMQGDIFNSTGIIIQRLLDKFCPDYLSNKKMNQVIRLLFEEVTRYFNTIYGYTLPFKEIIDKIMAGDTSYRGKTNDSVYDTATEATEEAPPVNDPNIRKPKVNGSKKMESAQAQIYHAYKNYKNAEQKIDSQISKMLQACKRLAIGDTRTEIIEGKKFSAIGLLKKALSTAAIFAFGPIKGIILLVVRYALKKKTTTAERRKILTELQVELEMINEKINDAKGDGNRQAKYAMMRTKAEIEAAIGQIKYGLEVDQRNMEGAKNALNNAIGVNKRRGF